MRAMMPVDPNRKVKPYTRKQKIIGGIVLVGILLVFLVGRIVIKAQMYNNETASVTTSTDTTSSTTETKPAPIGDQEYITWYTGHSQKVMNLLNQAVQMEPFIYSDHPSGDFYQYTQILQQIQDLSNQAFDEPTPADPQLAQIDTEYRGEMFLLKNLTEITSDYYNEDKDPSYKVGFNNEKDYEITAAQRIVDTTKELILYEQQKGITQ